jgi:thiol:disulfide interchange protein
MRAMRAAALGRGAAALLVLLLLVAGLPVLLVVVSGNPLPDSLPAVEEVRTALTAPDDGTLLLGALTWIAWIGWAVFTASVVVDVVSRLRGVAAPRLGPQQRAATMLVGAAAAIAIAAAAVPQAAPPEPPTAATELQQADSAPALPETRQAQHEVPAQEPAEAAEDVAAPLEGTSQSEAESAWRDNLAQHAGEPDQGEWRDRISTPFGGQR